MKFSITYLISALFFLLSCCFLLEAKAGEPSISDSQGVSLTIYNRNFGLVKDIRSINLKPGVNYVRVEDIAATIDPTSVSFQSLTAPNTVVVREQNYQYDLLNPATVLTKSLGKAVKFKQFLPQGSVQELSGTLLNPPQAVISDTEGNTSTSYQGLVLKTADGIVLNPSGQAELSELPAGLVPKPSLLWKLECTKAGVHKTEIGYQASSMSWRADYVAVLNTNDDKVDLTSWVTLDNKSGASYKNASLKLLAGDVHRIQDDTRALRGSMGMVMEAAPEPQFKEQSFAEYHLYTLAGKTDLLNNETKQLSLFSGDLIPVKKLFIYEPEASSFVPVVQGSSNNFQKVNVKIELANSKQNNLGVPMPKGKVRVYKKDQDSALQFIGEDMIDHTPAEEKVRLYLGDAFDLVAEKRQTAVVHVSSRVQRMSYEISLRNHKQSDVTINCVEHAWGDWRILNSNQLYAKKDAHTFEFIAKVPAGGETKVTYQIEMRY